MNKAELIEQIAEKVESTKADAANFLAALIDTVHENLHEGVRIAGIGHFAVAKRKSRIARNPQTGEEIKVAAKWAPVSAWSAAWAWVPVLASVVSKARA